MSGVRFVEPQTNLKFALTSVANATSHKRDIHMRMQYPEKYGWGGVALGKQMKGSLMFLVYPSKNGTGATLSIRTADGDEEPVRMLGVNCQTQRMKTANKIVDAAFVCHNIAGDSRLKSNPSSTHWIWAVGPGGSSATGNNRDSQDVHLSQHNYYGQFTLDMTKANVPAPVPNSKTNKQQPTATTTRRVLHATKSRSFVPTVTPTILPAIPQISGPTSSGSTTTSASSEPSATLVIAHAILLGSCFFRPLAWICQATATILSFIGMFIAISMSLGSEEHKHFDAGHQILGLLAILLLLPQAAFGSVNHMKYKRGGWASSVMAVVHINLGRVIMLLGMIAAVTGFALSGETALAGGFAVLTLLVIMLVAGLTYFDRKKRMGQAKEEAEERMHELRQSQTVNGAQVTPITGAHERPVRSEWEDATVYGPGGFGELGPINRPRPTRPPRPDSIYS